MSNRYWREVEKERARARQLVEQQIRQIKREKAEKKKDKKREAKDGVRKRKDAG